MDKRPEPLIRADELEDIGAESSLTRAMAAQTIRLLYAEKEWYRTKWVGLTNEEMLTAAWQAGFDIHEDYDNEDGDTSDHWWTEDGEQCDETLFKLRDVIEAKLKEKNAND